MDYKERGKRIIKLANVLSFKHIEEKYTAEYEKQELIEDLKAAHREWKDKESHFNDVTDPDLIDHAIYEIEASKIKYFYFLKKIKENHQL